MLLVQILWTGFAGAPGYTNLAFLGDSATPAPQGNVDTVVARADAFAQAMVANAPAAVNVQVSGEVKQVDPATGALQAILAPQLQPAGHQGQGLDPNFSGASGACIDWTTSTIQGNRVIRGRTFVVPLSNFAYDGGSLKGDVLTQLRAAATALVTESGAEALPFAIWSRPRPATAPGGARAGKAGRVVASTVPDLAAVLRSRRD
jgi:hypothetical protein